jgi:hypothetical protein
MSRSIIAILLALGLAGCQGERWKTFSHGSILVKCAEHLR